MSSIDTTTQPARREKTINELVGELKAEIHRMNPNDKRDMQTWLPNQKRYLEWEKNFDPKLIRKYNRGDVAFINFGYNVGAEFRGHHYGVVLDDNAKSSETLIVVPLSSLGGKTIEDLDDRDVYLGKIEGINDNEAIARVGQIRSVSKLRILKPKKEEHGIITMKSEYLDLIDEKIRNLYTRALPNNT